jgi:predicted transcriptional regulator
MKTTVEIRDQLFRKIKSVAAERDQTLKDFFNEALQEKLASMRARSPSDAP